MQTRLKDFRFFKKGTKELPGIATFFGIKTIEEANQYLENEFLSFINLKFSCAPKDAENAHRNAAIYGDLDEIICWKIERQVRNDWTIRYKNEYFQLREPDDKNLTKPGRFITLKKYLNGEIRFWADNTHIKHGVLSRKPKPPSRDKKYYVATGPVPAEIQSKIARKNKHKSPFGQFNPGWLSKGKKTAVTQNQSHI